jgi:hypothetical protein
VLIFIGRPDALLLDNQSTVSETTEEVVGIAKHDAEINTATAPLVHVDGSLADVYGEDHETAGNKRAPPVFEHGIELPRGTVDEAVEREDSGQSPRSCRQTGEVAHNKRLIRAGRTRLVYLAR